MKALAAGLLVLAAAASAAERKVSTPYMWGGSNGGSGTMSRIDTANGGVTIFGHAGTNDWGAVDPAGNLWTTDRSRGVVRRFNASSG
ncbi:MAG: hypothetical protein NTY77_15160, partial [Elusimicrobia bacterium]|nr:hypothetical protein [Elusimicrobiota bacterium]